MEENMKTMAIRYERLCQHWTKDAALDAVWRGRPFSDLRVLKDEWQNAEDEFYELQERYDRFVERHYHQRYEPWYDQVSERYRRRIRRQFFLIMKMETLLNDSCRSAEWLFCLCPVVADENLEQCLYGEIE